MEKDKKKEPCGDKVHTYNAKERYDYLKAISGLIVEELGTRKFAVSQDELNVFLNY